MKTELLRVALSCALLLTFISPRALAAQDMGGDVTTAEEREARAVASAFSDRLVETHDFALVVDEMYAEGFMSRHLKGVARRAGAGGSEVKTFMVEGVPSLRFKSSLMADADDENWPRLYAAANALMYYRFLAYLSKEELEGFDDPDESDDEALMRDLYPPEAVKVLDANPALANFVAYKGRAADVETAENLRSVTLALEEAARLTRASIYGHLPSSAFLEENMRMTRRIQAELVVSLAEDEEAFGYPKGTRLLRVFSSVGYFLILVREGEKLKVVGLAYPRC